MRQMESCRSCLLKSRDCEHWPNLGPGTFNGPNSSTPKEQDNAAGRPHHHVISTDTGFVGPGHRQQAESHRRTGANVRQCLGKGPLFRPSRCAARAAGGSVRQSGGRAGPDAAIRPACRGSCSGGLRGAVFASSGLSAGKGGQEAAPWREEEAGGCRNELSGGMQLPIDLSRHELEVEMANMDAPLSSRLLSSPWSSLPSQRR